MAHYKYQCVIKDKDCAFKERTKSRHYICTKRKEYQNGEITKAGEIGCLFEKSRSNP